MRYAYDSDYLPLAQRVLGDMYDFAVNTLQYTLKEFHMMFLVCGMSQQFEIGNPTFIAGKNGCEIAKIVVYDCYGNVPEEEDEMYVDKSPEFWVGWALSYYQWVSCLNYKIIQEKVPITEIYGMYATLHETDISKFVTIMDEKCKKQMEESRLKRLRTYAGLSQAQLADFSGVPLRQIQLFEQGQRDIRKTQAMTLLQLARTLQCDCMDLL